MPARGTLSIKNTTGTKKAQLVIKYSGNLDEVTSNSFKNVTWGDGTIELSNGRVRADATAKVMWHDRQGKGPTWKSLQWKTSKAAFKKKLGDTPVDLERVPGTV